MSGAHWRSEESIGSLGTGDTECCQTTVWVLGIKPGPLEKQQMCLTAEPFPHPAPNDKVGHLSGCVHRLVFEPPLLVSQVRQSLLSLYMTILS